MKNLRLTVCFVAAAGCSVLLAEQPGNKGSGKQQLSDTLVWLESDGKGSFSKSKEHNSTPTPAADDGAVKAKGVDSHGNIVEVPLRRLHVHRFSGKDYTAELPGWSRKDGMVFGVNISGTAGQGELKGTVVNLDGAVFGFQVDSTAPAIDGQLLVRLVTLQADKWVATSVSFLADATTRAVPGVKVSAKIHQGPKTWDLYNQNIVVAEGIPLSDRPKHPSITIQPGSNGAVAELRDVQVSHKPLVGHAVPADGERMNLRKAYEDGDPSAQYFDSGK